MVYTTVDDVALIVSRLGKGALMAKVDIESAYRLVPVHPEDRPLLVAGPGVRRPDAAVWAEISTKNL